MSPIPEFWHALGYFVEQLPQITEFTHYTTGWNTPQGTQTGDPDDMGGEDDTDGGNEEIATNAGPQTQMRHLGSADGGMRPNPREYRRQELEDHAHTGRPIVREPRLSNTFLRRLIAARGSQLRKLQIHGIVVDMDQVREITSGCLNLSELVLHLYEGTPVRLDF